MHIVPSCLVYYAVLSGSSDWKTESKQGTDGSV